MSKAKKYAVENESAFDDAFQASIDQAQKTYIDNVYTGDEESARCLCLPVPALAPRVLLQQEGLPIGRFILLDGPKESFKSSLLYEIIRWHRKLGGRGKIIEVEDKKSPDLCLSINEYDHKAFSIHFCETMEGWNEALTYWISAFKEIMDGKGKNAGLGRCYPVCFGVDSIMAAVGEDIMEKILKDGSSSKHFATDAALLSDYLKAFTKWLAGYPFTVVGVNHLKPTQDMRTGVPIRHMPGGKAPEYHASLDIEVKKIKEEKRVKYDSARLKLMMKKNSVAPKNDIMVEVIWYIDIDHPTEDGECLQRTYFDWDSASIECIFDTMESAGKEIKSKIKDVTGFISVNDSKRIIKSDVLGIGSDGVTWHEAGKLLEIKIQEDKSFRDILYPLLGIRRRHMFQPKIDYREQIKQALVENKKTQVLREKVIKASPVESMRMEDNDDNGSLEIS